MAGRRGWCSGGVGQAEGGEGEDMVGEDIVNPHFKVVLFGGLLGLLVDMANSDN